jgi:hypothetical protein
MQSGKTRALDARSTGGEAVVLRSGDVGPAASVLQRRPLLFALTVYR